MELPPFFRTLRDIGILSETTGKRRDRVFMYDQYMKTLSQGTEPLNGLNR